MISDDLAHLSDRLAGHALHGTAPTRDELGLVAAELLKLSNIVKQMEGLPFDHTLLQPFDPATHQLWPVYTWMAHSYGTKDPDKL